MGGKAGNVDRPLRRRNGGSINKNDATGCGRSEMRSKKGAEKGGAKNEEMKKRENQKRGKEGST